MLHVGKPSVKKYVGKGRHTDLPCRYIIQKYVGKCENRQLSEYGGNFTIQSITDTIDEFLRTKSLH